MIKTIIGLILLLIPFLLIYRFKDKRVGFFYVLSFLIAGILLISLVTQIFGVFRYSPILGIFIAIDLFLLTKINFKELAKALKLIKIDWIFIIVLAVLFISLYSVHYNYTGEIKTINGEEEAKNMKYPYPYFSDEWASAAFVKYSIASGKLPLANPLWHTGFFPNLAFPFHSFISQIMLLLGLDPVIRYSWLHIFAGILICSLVYFILAFNRVNKWASAIASLSVLLIANGATLPGIWYFIPIMMGIIGMLLSFAFMSLKDTKMTLFASFLSMIFYPPLVIFMLVSLIFYFAFKEKDKKVRVKSMIFWPAVFMAVVLAIVLCIYAISNFSANETINSLKSRICYDSIYKIAIPNFPILKIVPFYAVVLAVLGLFGFYKGFKEKLWLIAPIITGLILWAIYSKTLKVFIIAYGRSVLVTSILIVILSGFGINYIINSLRKSERLKKYKVIEVISIIVLFLFLINSFFYTQGENWRAFDVNIVNSTDSFETDAPANRYLHKADLELFGQIHGKNFLTYPWKGLVIGTATDNYPLITKPSIVNNALVDLDGFLKANCGDKLKLAEEKEIDYVYLNKIDCPGFKLVNISIEGLYLYEVTKE